MKCTDARLYLNVGLTDSDAESNKT